jgi:hypothetical protein
MYRRVFRCRWIRRLLVLFSRVLPEEIAGEMDDESNSDVLEEDDLILDTTDAMLITFLLASRRR